MKDEKSVGLNILSFLFPIVGWVLYFVLKGETPIKAKSCGIWGLVGFGASLLLQLLTCL